MFRQGRIYHRSVQRLLVVGGSFPHVQTATAALLLKMECFQNSWRDGEIRHEDDVETRHTAQHIHEEFLRFVQELRAALGAYLARMAWWKRINRFAPRAKAFVSPRHLRDLFPHIQGSYD